MKRWYIFLAGLVLVVTVAAGWYWRLPLLPAGQETITLLYTGDGQGYLVPCPT